MRHVSAFLVTARTVCTARSQSYATWLGIDLPTFETTPDVPSLQEDSDQTCCSRVLSAADGPAAQLVRVDPIGSGPSLFMRLTIKNLFTLGHPRVQAKVAAWLAEGHTKPDAHLFGSVELHSQTMCQVLVNPQMVQPGCEDSVEGSVSGDIMEERLPQQVYASLSDERKAALSGWSGLTAASRRSRSRAGATESTQPVCIRHQVDEACGQTSRPPQVTSANPPSSLPTGSQVNLLTG